MVPERVEASAAAACAGAERQEKTQPTKQQNPELWAGDSDNIGGGEDHKDPGPAGESSMARDAGQKVSKMRAF